jgi:S-adenosylmethionine:tRNA ribosyltransferase-isomerase
MKLSEFAYQLPAELIAQRPLPERDASRLLSLDLASKAWEDHRFSELPQLLRGDELVVVNNARVFPARLLGRRAGVRAERPGCHSRTRREFLKSPIEVLLTRQLSPDTWEALVRPGRKMPKGERIVFGEGELEAEVTDRGEYGLRQVRFSSAGDLVQALKRIGHVPLPPYIDRPDEPADRERYQTIFARELGAVAAPTAGLHFTPEVLERIRARGVQICEITLQVGLGTFQPIRSDTVEHHRMHSETYEIPPGTAGQLESALGEGRPILAVGTTVVRALEDAAQKDRVARPGKGVADLFIYPGYKFRVVGQLLTNFHLPKSTLLVMVAAFAGRELIQEAYQHAIRQHYRFYSYGDCMLVR